MIDEIILVYIKDDEIIDPFAGARKINFYGQVCKILIFKAK